MVGGNLGSGDALGTTLAIILPMFLGGYTVLVQFPQFGIQEFQ